MKTAIRTYHPIPALQKTNGNLQDAPRIKNILKSCLLDGEAKEGVPTTPLDILSRSVCTARLERNAKLNWTTTEVRKDSSDKRSQPDLCYGQPRHSTSFHMISDVY
jgi:hypothetical protein